MSKALTLNSRTMLHNAETSFPAFLELQSPKHTFFGARPGAPQRSEPYLRPRPEAISHVVVAASRLKPPMILLTAVHPSSPGKDPKTQLNERHKSDWDIPVIPSESEPKKQASLAPDPGLPAHRTPKNG